MNEPTSNRAAPAAKSSRLAKGIVFLIAFSLIGCGVWLVEAVKDAREAARHSQCRGHFGQLHLALHNYHEKYNCFPPAFMTDENGKPKHSWRVLILEFFSSEELAVYKQYDFNEPWDGPNNRTLANRINRRIFQCPSGPNYERSPMTDYVAVVGSQTAFPGSQCTSLSDFRDGPENTILLVEIANSKIHWMEPRDLKFDEMSFVVNDLTKPSISSSHPRGPVALFTASVHSWTLDGALRPETLKAMTTIAGGEVVSMEKLIQQSPNDRFLAE